MVCLLSFIFIFDGKVGGVMGNNRGLSPKKYKIMFSYFGAALLAATTTAHAAPQQINTNTILDANGQAEGIIFNGNYSLTVADGLNIGRSNQGAVDQFSNPVLQSVNTNSINQGNIVFQGNSTVAGVVGDPTSLFSIYMIGLTGPLDIDVAGSDKQVDFQDTIVAGQISISSDGIIRFLESIPVGHGLSSQVDITTSTNGTGTVIIETINKFSIHGNLGESGKKLKLISIAGSPLNAVGVHGNVYANGLQLNGESVIFERTSGEGTADLFGEVYIDSPIKTNTTGAGEVFVIDYGNETNGKKVHFLQQIGEPTRKLALFQPSQEVIVYDDVFANSVTLQNYVKGPLSLNFANDVNISDELRVRSYNALQPVLNLGTSTVTVGGATIIGEVGTAILRVAVNGANSGKLEASVAGATINASTIVDVNVLTSPPENNQQYTILTSNAPITVPGTITDNSAGWDFTLSQSGNSLILTAHSVTNGTSKPIPTLSYISMSILCLMLILIAHRRLN